MSAGVSFSKNIVYRIFALGTGSLYKWTTKANLLNLVRFHSMSRNMFDPISRPDETSNRHFRILSGAIAVRKVARAKWDRMALI
jgi:hypothetical protein